MFDKLFPFWLADAWMSPVPWELWKLFILHSPRPAPVVALCHPCSISPNVWAIRSSANDSWGSLHRFLALVIYVALSSLDLCSPIIASSTSAYDLLCLFNPERPLCFAWDSPLWVANSKLLMGRKPRRSQGSLPLPLSFQDSQFCTACCPMSENSCFICFVRLSSCVENKSGTGCFITAGGRSRLELIQVKKKMHWKVLGEFTEYK